MYIAVRCRDPLIALRHLLMGATIALLSACTVTDPLYQSGRWEATNVNQANLIAQIANPDDLHHGRQVTGSDALVAAAAVARLRQDRVKKLPDSGLAQITLSSGSTASDASASGIGGL